MHSRLRGNLRPACGKELAMPFYDLLNLELVRAVGVASVISTLLVLIFAMMLRERFFISRLSQSAFYHAFDDGGEEASRVRVPETPTNIEMSKEIARIMTIVASSASGVAAVKDLVRSLIHLIPPDQRSSLQNELQDINDEVDRRPN